MATKTLESRSTPTTKEPSGLVVHAQQPYEATPEAETYLQALGASKAFLELASPPPGIVAKVLHALHIAR
jgi:hypothetical protein